MKKNNFIFLIILLGMLSAFGPVVTDLYLPALPFMADFFKTNSSLAQMSLTMSMLGLATGQIFIGPFSDKYGRKSLLLWSLILFVVSTVLCIFSPDIYIFNLMRLLQGMAASGGIVISRSVSADLFGGRELTKFLALIAAVNGIAPVVSPVLGGVLMNVTTWKGLFLVLLFFGVVLLVMSTLYKESLPVEKRTSHGVVALFRIYGKIFKNSRYVIYLLIFAFSALVLFGYISASPFVLQKEYQLSPLMFSLCFGLNAIGIMIGALLGARIKNEHQSVLLGAGILLIAAVYTAIMLSTKQSVGFVEGGFLLMMFSFGVLQPGISSLILNSERENAGTASAAMGASGFLFGGLVSPLVGIGNIFYTSSIVFVCGALITLSMAIYAVKKFGKEKGHHS